MLPNIERPHHDEREAAEVGVEQRQDAFIAREQPRDVPAVTVFTLNSRPGT